MNEAKILQQLHYLTTVVLGLRQDQKVLAAGVRRLEAKLADSKRGLKRRVTVLTAENKKLQKALSGLEDLTGL